MPWVSECTDGRLNCKCMSVDLVLSNPIVIARFERYFRHPDPHHDVLQPGDRAIACRNAMIALTWLGIARFVTDDVDLYDKQLRSAVRRFQQQEGHPRKDGKIGPNTRALLVMRLLERYGATKLYDLTAPEGGRNPVVFMSYARADKRFVEEMHSFLQDHGVQVLRDETAWTAGTQIPDNVWRSTLEADKVVAVYSAESKTRDWPRFEHQAAETVERLLRTPVLVYLRLDDTPLPAHDTNRLFIDARCKPVPQVGLEVLRAVRSHRFVDVE